MKTVGAALLVTTLFFSSAFGATGPVGPLAPGKPAGVKEARIYSSTLFWMALGAAALTALAFSGGSSSSTTSP